MDRLNQPRFNGAITARKTKNKLPMIRAKILSSRRIPGKTLEIKAGFAISQVKVVAHNIGLMIALKKFPATKS